MLKTYGFDKLFARRCVFAFFFFICLSLFSVLRLSVITMGGKYAKLQKEQSTKSVIIGRNRGTVYDTNMLPLTNNKSTEYLAFMPTNEGKAEAEALLSGEEKESALKTLKRGDIAIAEKQGKVDSKWVATAKIYSTDDNTFLARHIIGYTDKDGRGVCGIEKAYDGVLFREKTVNASCEIDGKGRLLFSEAPTIENNLSDVLSGIRLTVDTKIQNIVEQETKELKKGAAVILEAKTGKIRAIKSSPDYSADNLAKSLKKKGSPMLNRALTPFSVGSVFKPCVASVAYESGLKDMYFNCSGKTHIIDRDFSCHKKDGHGYVNLKDALAFSCNTFFYNLGINLGAESIYKKATVLNFGNKIKLCDNLFSDAGNLTSLKSLTNSAQIANFSIGQGDLQLSPVAISTLYMSIANGGYYIMPSVVEGVFDGGKETPYKTAAKTNVMSKECAEYLLNALEGAVESGTATDAKLENLKIAGKTATAQTGRYKKDKTEITNSWFCGIFPAENPRFVGVVMSDGETNVSLPRTFAEIAEKISELS